MISHDLAVPADTCDRLAVMYAGRVVEEGPARQIYEDARHPYGRALSGAFPRIGDPASRFAPRGLPVTHRTRRRCRPGARSIRGARSRWTSAPRRTRHCGRRERTGGRRACTWGPTAPAHRPPTARRPAAHRRRGTRSEEQHPMTSTPTTSTPTTGTAPSLLSVQGIGGRLPRSAAAPAARPWTGSISTSGGARSSRWSASRAAGRPHSPAACSAGPADRRPRHLRRRLARSGRALKAYRRGPNWSSRTRAAH